MRTRLLALVATLTAALALAAAPAGAADRFDVLSVATLGHLQPVKGSDGRQHLVYELTLRNVSSEWGVVIDRVEVRNARTDQVVATRAGDTLLPNMDLGDPFSRPHTTTIGPGQTGVVWMDVTFASRAAVPAAIRHVIALQPAPGVDPDAFAVRFGPDVTTGAVKVDRRPPVVLGAPLKGDGFVAFNGCCTSLGHTRTALAVEGRQRVAERYAIDFMQADRDGTLWTGDGTRNEDYFVYDEPIHNVRRGRVVATSDGQPDTPALTRTNATSTPGLAAGNHVIVDIGGLYVLYAHIKPGTVAVKPGDRVRKGQVIGRVGSSGNSDAPHLHIHVTNRPSPLAADGRPYVFERFALEGQVVDDEVRWLPSPSPRRAELPLDMTVVSFP